MMIGRKHAVVIFLLFLAVSTELDGVASAAYIGREGRHARRQAGGGTIGNAKQVHVSSKSHELENDKASAQTGSDETVPKDDKLDHDGAEQQHQNNENWRDTPREQVPDQLVINRDDYVTVGFERANGRWEVNPFDARYPITQNHGFVMLVFVTCLLITIVNNKVILDNNIVGQTISTSIIILMYMILVITLVGIKRRRLGYAKSLKGVDPPKFLRDKEIYGWTLCSFLFICYALLSSETAWKMSSPRKEFQKKHHTLQGPIYTSGVVYLTCFLFIAMSVRSHVDDDFFVGLVQFVMTHIILLVTMAWGYYQNRVDFPGVDTFDDAIYLASIVHTTVGYGDLGIEKGSGRSLAAFHAILVFLLNVAARLAFVASSIPSRSKLTLPKVKEHIDGDDPDVTFKHLIEWGHECLVTKMEYINNRRRELKKDVDRISTVSMAMAIFLLFCQLITKTNVFRLPFFSHAATRDEKKVAWILISLDIVGVLLMFCCLIRLVHKRLRKKIRHTNDISTLTWVIICFITSLLSLMSQEGNLLKTASGGQTHGFPPVSTGVSWLLIFYINNATHSSKVAPSDQDFAGTLQLMMHNFMIVLTFADLYWAFRKNFGHDDAEGSPLKIDAFEDAIYASIITHTTVGFGDINGSPDRLAGTITALHSLLCLIFNFIGLGMVIQDFEDNSEEMEEGMSALKAVIHASKMPKDAADMLNTTAYSLYSSIDDAVHAAIEKERKLLRDEDDDTAIASSPPAANELAHDGSGSNPQDAQAQTDAHISAVPVDTEDSDDLEDSPARSADQDDVSAAPADDSDSGAQHDASAAAPAEQEFNNDASEDKKDDDADSTHQTNTGPVAEEGSDGPVAEEDSDDDDAADPKAQQNTAPAQQKDSDDESAKQNNSDTPAPGETSDVEEAGHSGENGLADPEETSDGEEAGHSGENESVDPQETSGVEEAGHSGENGSVDPEETSDEEAQGSENGSVDENEHSVPVTVSMTDHDAANVDKDHSATTTTAEPSSSGKKVKKCKKKSRSVGGSLEEDCEE